MRLPGFAAVAAISGEQWRFRFSSSYRELRSGRGALESPLNRLGKSLETPTAPEKGGFTSATSVIRADGNVLSVGHT